MEKLFNLETEALFFNANVAKGINSKISTIFLNTNVTVDVYPIAKLGNMILYMNQNINQDDNNIYDSKNNIIDDGSRFLN